MTPVGPAYAAKGVSIVKNEQKPIPAPKNSLPPYLDVKRAIILKIKSNLYFLII